MAARQTLTRWRRGREQDVERKGHGVDARECPGRGVAAQLKKDPLASANVASAGANSSMRDATSPQRLLLRNQRWTPEHLVFQARREYYLYIPTCKVLPTPLFGRYSSIRHPEALLFTHVLLKLLQLRCQCCGRVGAEASPNRALTPVRSTSFFFHLQYDEVAMD